MTSTRCEQCRKTITEGKYLTVGTSKYHADCFRCKHCSLVIDGKYVEYGERKQIYHPSCVEKIQEEEAMKKGNICKKCKLACFNGKYISLAGGDLYHTGCFQCKHCSLAIEGNYVEYGESKQPHHPQCVEKVRAEEAVKEGKICKKCGQACCNGKYISLADGDLYHAECFQCIDCGKLISGSYIKHGQTNVPLHADCARKRDIAAAKAQGRICKKCHKVCFEGRIMTVSENEIYHAACFTCTYCKKAIESRYAQHGPENLPYHVDCLDVVRGTSNSTSAKNTTRRIDKQNSVTNKETPRVCKQCKQVCDVGKFYTTKTNEIYHADCFRCSDPKCNGAITGTYTEYGEPPLPYHPACGKELFAPRCCLCTHTLEGQFYKHPFFESEIYCISHETRPSCFACGRKQPLPESHREGFADLMDGRSLCAQCSSSIIVDSSEAAALYQGIVEFMGRELGLSIPAGMKEVPILLVDFQSLNENRNKLGEVLGYHTDPAANPDGTETSAPPTSHIFPSLEPGNNVLAPTTAILTPTRRAALGKSHTEGIIRGVTMSTCSKVKYLPSTGLQFDTTGKGLVARLPTPEVYQVKQVRDVTAVLVLYGLPRDLTASILAHEAMHVWLKLNKSFPFQMPPKIEEGLCQVIAHMYLEHLVALATLRATTTPSQSVLGGGSVKLAHAPSVSSFGSLAAPPSVAPSSAPRSPLKRPTSVVLKPKTKPKIKSLTKWFSEQIETDKSPIYGQGFQEAHRAVSVLGLSAVLSYIQRHQCLPPLRK